MPIIRQMRNRKILEKGSEKQAWDAYSDVLKPYSEKSFDKIHKNIMAFCEYCRTAVDVELYASKFIDDFVGSLFFIFSRDDFSIPPEYIPSYFRLYKTIADLIRISKYRNSDAILKALLTNPANNLVKILILYSAYNSFMLDRKKLLSINKKGVSFWFCNFFSNFLTALSDSYGYKHLKYHMSVLDLELAPIEEFKGIFFSLTFIDNERDQYWKRKFNTFIHENKFLEDIVQIDKKSYPRNKIAIISGCWHQNHSVYRNQYHFLKALSEKYELTLFNVAPLKNPLDEELFKEVHHIIKSDEKIDTSKLAGQFPLIYYTDIGMHASTTLLSNARLAPIQVTSYGHSVSTFGSKIDYWIGGLQGERGTSNISESDIQKHYSETFIGLPGLGITNTIPDYVLKNTPKAHDRYIINCSWCAQKINLDLIHSLKNILNRAKRQDIVFRIFACTSGLTLHTLRHILEEYLGKHAEIIPLTSSSKFMEIMEEGQFSIEPYPFGGCNTVVDALWLRQPIVCLEGNHWYSKIGTAVMLKAGIDLERNLMLASSVQQYEDYIVNLINDKKLLESAQRQVLNADLNSTLFENSEATHFVEAMDRLLTLFFGNQ